LEKACTALPAWTSRDHERAAFDAWQHVLGDVSIILGKLALAHSQVGVNVARRMREAHARNARSISVMGGP
jgi:hypothetical protein